MGWWRHGGSYAKLYVNTGVACLKRFKLCFKILCFKLFINMSGRDILTERERERQF